MVPVIVVLPAVMVLVVLIVEPSVMTAPLIVPLLIKLFVIVLFVNVSKPPSVTITPELGNIALEAIPVPPLAVES